MERPSRSLRLAFTGEVRGEIERDIRSSEEPLVIVAKWDFLGGVDPAKATANQDQTA